MKLETLTVNGMLAIGGTTSIDLRDLPPGLIAVVGPNGNGKTTLLDAAPASIHRKFPSRSDKTLEKYATERDSFIESTWSFEGRGLIKLRVSLDGVKGASKAVISQINGDGTETPLSDGSKSDYDEKVAQLFPPRDVLLSSAVAAQNKEGSFSRIERHERQALFAKLLGLERYKQMAETAKALAAKCDAARGTLAGRRDILTRDADPSVFEALEAELAQKDADRHQTATTRQDLTARRARLEQERDSYREAAHQHVTAKERLRQLGDLSLTEMQGNAAIVRKKDKAEETAKAELDQAERAHRKTLQDLDERIRNNETVLERADEIRAAHAALIAWTDDVAFKEPQHYALQTKVHDQSAAIAAVEQDLKFARLKAAELDRATNTAAMLGTVPCGGEGEYAKCHVLTAAKAAAAAIPALQADAAKIEALEQSLATLRAEQVATTSEKSALGVAIAEARKKVAELTPLAKLLPNIETAEQRIAELRADRARAVDLHAATCTAIKTRLDQALATLTAEGDAILQRIDAIGAEIAQLNIVVEETQDASDHLARCHEDLAALATEWDLVTATAATIDAAIADLQRRRERFHAAQAELADVSARLRTVEDDLLDYQLLAKALGKDGLPTLEIDAAGPTVSAFCNDLLATCFGSRFSVELVTQEATAKGGFKEAFELKVYDNERGGEPRDLEDLSGGEQIIVDEALKNAIAAFVNSRNVSPVQTMWRDETTGPLDGPNAAQYLQMLRRIREIAGCHQLIFVTHNEDAKLQADAQIVLERGQARVQLPPYAAA